MRKLKESEACLEKADDAMKEKEKAIKQVESLSREIDQMSNLKEAKDSFALKDMEEDKLKLSKSNEKLRNELSTLFAENSKMKMDIHKANKKIESLKNENKKVIILIDNSGIARNQIFKDLFNISLFFNLHST